MTEPNAPGSYGGKAIASLSDKQLALAESDVANCLLRAFDAPDPPHDPKYRQYFARMSDLANAIQAEKEGRTDA